jgi:AAA family ATP:ADP antiporter
MSLATTLVAVALATTAFWIVLPFVMPAGAVLFYVYTGVVATILVPRFWLLLASRFTVGDAKRYYGAVGLGGVAGAGAGSVFATFLLARVSVLALLLAGAATYLAAATIGRLLARRPTNSKSPGPLRARSVEPKTYLRRLTVLAVVASATLTVVDYLFKSVVAATVPAAELGTYFARTYTTINVLAIIAQVFVVPRLLRHLGTHSAAALLPALLLVGAGSFALAAVPLLVIAVRAADGTLRNSLHRITMELFYFPLPDDVRERWKGAADALGQRGGQALAALLLLALVALGASSRWIAVAAGVLAFAWLVLVQLARRPYVELFRASLRRGSIPANIPPLGSATLQAMLEAFSSPDDAVVCGALDFLVVHGNVRLVPAVMVDHPSRTVATHALDILVTAQRADVPRIIEHLTNHRDPVIRVSALKARMQRGASDDELLTALDDAAVEVRTTAMVNLLSRTPHICHARREIDAIIAANDIPAKIALARAIEGHHAAELRTDLVRLLTTPDVALRIEVLDAMTRKPDTGYLPTLLPLLGDRRLLADARRAILASSFGDSSNIERWLIDETLPRFVRRHIPRTLSAFGTARAAAALIGRLQDEPDSAVRYKILRGLGRMRAGDPSLPIDDQVLKKAARLDAERATDLLAWRVALAAASGSNSLETLLVASLKEKEDRALERVFRILGILHPDCELERVWRGIHSTDARSRDVSLELVDQLERHERARLTALLAPEPDFERLRRTGRRPPTRERALRDLTRDRSMPLRTMANFLLHDEVRGHAA